MSFKLPELKYSYDALEPYIDRETMEVHHQGHHASYFTKLNKALEKYDVGDRTLEDIIRNLNKDIPGEIYWDVKNQGGGAYNHSLFFEMLSPKGGGAPKGRLMNKIKHDFGGFEAFKEKFKTHALSRFGSGWTWLITDDSYRLQIKTTSNQDCPISDNKHVILGIDIWEHAYYLKYKNKRDLYVDAWWNVVNWDLIEGTFEEIMKK